MIKLIKRDLTSEEIINLESFRLLFAAETLKGSNVENLSDSGRLTDYFLLKAEPSYVEDIFQLLKNDSSLSMSFNIQECCMNNVLGMLETNPTINREALFNSLRLALMAHRRELVRGPFWNPILAALNVTYHAQRDKQKEILRSPINKTRTEWIKNLRIAFIKKYKIIVPSVVLGAVTARNVLKEQERLINARPKIKRYSTTAPNVDEIIKPLKTEEATIAAHQTLTIPVVIAMPTNVDDVEYKSTIEQTILIGETLKQIKINIEVN